MKNENRELRINKWRWLAIQIVLVLLFAAALFVYLVNLNVHRLTNAKAKNSITEIKLEDRPRVAIVFGAGLTANGAPSPALYDRVITAVELYRANRVSKLLMSGDNSIENYNEPQAMKKLAIQKGIPENVVEEDIAGSRTYDTCRRAKENFGVTRAVLVTQEFHVPRALYLCESFGIDSYAMSADRRNYPESSKNWWKLREFFATVAAWIDINLRHPEMVIETKEPI